jgi:hypothetical protein
MELLPLDVLCLVLEQLEVSRWLLRLRAVSRAWRRAVERVAGKVLPLALCQHGRHVFTTVALPFPGGEASHAAVGESVLEVSGDFWRLEGASLVRVLAALPMMGLWICGHGYALLCHDETGEGALLRFRKAELAARVPVRRETMEKLQHCKTMEMAPDGTVWACFDNDDGGDDRGLVRCIELASGAVREERRLDEALRSRGRCAHVTNGRYVDAAYQDEEGTKFMRFDMRTGTVSHLAVSYHAEYLGACQNGLVAVQHGRSVMVYDFAANRLVGLELHQSEKNLFARLRFHTVSDALIVATGCWLCAIFRRCDGRRLWSLAGPEMTYTAFCGPALLVFTAEEVTRVDWNSAAE